MRVPADRANHGGLRSTAPSRHGAEQSAGQIGGTCCKKFAVGFDGRVRGAAKARPAAIVSVKLINAMPSAPGKSCWTRPRLGRVIGGSDRGMNPTVATPEGIQTDEP